MRLNKFIAQHGVCSRRQAERYIEEGKVKVNGKRALLTTPVLEGDEVSVMGKEIRINNEKVYVAFNKPIGVICTEDKQADNTIYDYLDLDTRVFYVGRLDVASCGLMLLTNDGDFANEVNSNQVEKEYIVKVTGTLTDDVIKRLANGVMIDGYQTKKARVYKLANRRFRIVLKEGKNRQIRKMCQALGYSVEKLERIRIGKMRGDSIKIGKHKKIEKKMIL